MSRTDSHARPRPLPAVRLVRVVGIVVVAVGLLVASLRAAEIIRVAPLARDGQVLVSFELTDAYTEEVREAIGSGLTTTFSYDVGLRREAPVWFDRSVDSKTVTASVRFDNLTRRYQLSRSHDGRVEDARVTEDEADVKVWMTLFERLPLFSSEALEPNSEYYLRVRVRSQRRRTWPFWPFWPWGRFAAGAVAKFTFLP